MNECINRFLTLVIVATLAVLLPGTVTASKSKDSCAIALGSMREPERWPQEVIAFPVSTKKASDYQRFVLLVESTEATYLDSVRNWTLAGERARDPESGSDHMKVDGQDLLGTWVSGVYADPRTRTVRVFSGFVESVTEGIGSGHVCRISDADATKPKIELRLDPNNPDANLRYLHVKDPKPLKPLDPPRASDVVVDSSGVENKLVQTFSSSQFADVSSEAVSQFDSATRSGWTDAGDTRGDSVRVEQPRLLNDVYVAGVEADHSGKTVRTFSGRVVAVWNDAPAYGASSRFDYTKIRVQPEHGGPIEIALGGTSLKRLRAQTAVSHETGRETTPFGISTGEIQSLDSQRYSTAVDGTLRSYDTAIRGQDWQAAGEHSSGGVRLENARLLGGHTIVGVEGDYYGKRVRTFAGTVESIGSDAGSSSRVDYTILNVRTADGGQLIQVKVRDLKRLHVRVVNPSDSASATTTAREELAVNEQTVPVASMLSGVVQKAAADYDQAVSADPHWKFPGDEPSAAPDFVRISRPQGLNGKRVSGVLEDSSGGRSVTFVGTVEDIADKGEPGRPYFELQVALDTPLPDGTSIAVPASGHSLIRFRYFEPERALADVVANKSSNQGIDVQTRPAFTESQFNNQTESALANYSSSLAQANWKLAGTQTGTTFRDYKMNVTQPKRLEGSVVSGVYADADAGAVRIFAGTVTAVGTRKVVVREIPRKVPIAEITPLDGSELFIIELGTQPLKVLNVLE